jgi:hypothetical protein
VSYIGVQPKAGQYRNLDDISSGFNGVTTTFTTAVNGQNVTATSFQQLLVSLGGVIQQPGVDYITSTNSITFTTAPTAGLSFFGILMGDAVNVGVPTDNSVSTVKIVDNAVTTAKLNSAGIAPVLTSVNGGPLAGSRNRIINGDMRIDQRFAGGSTNPGFRTYFVDRWAVGDDTTGTLVAGQNSSVPAGQGYTTSLRAAVGVTDTSLSTTEEAFMDQRIEGYNIADFNLGTASAKQFTLSFWVRSSITGTYTVALSNSALNRSYVAPYTISAADTWEYKTITLTGDTSGTWLTDNGIGIRIKWVFAAGPDLRTATPNSWIAGNFSSVTGAANLMSITSSAFHLTGVQLELGPVATPFEQRSYGQELALCQRYYEKTYDLATVPGTATQSGQITALAVNGAFTRWRWTFKVEKRSAPSVTGYSPRTGSTSLAFANLDDNVDQSSSVGNICTSSAEFTWNNTTNSTGKYGAIHGVASIEL